MELPSPLYLKILNEMLRDSLFVCLFVCFSSSQCGGSRDNNIPPSLSGDNQLLSTVLPLLSCLFPYTFCYRHSSETSIKVIPLPSFAWIHVPGFPQDPSFLASLFCLSRSLKKKVGIAHPPVSQTHEQLLLRALGS